MAEEEKRVERDEGTSVGRGIANVAGRMGEGLIDALAQRVPLLGAPLQAAFETPDYQDRQMRREMNKLALVRAQQENKEWEEGAAARKAKNEAALMAAQEYKAGAGDRFDQKVFDRQKRDAAREQFAMQHAQNEEWRKNAPVREVQSDAELSRARLAQEQADGQYMSIKMNGLEKSLGEDLGKNPAFQGMSFDERNSFIKSPSVQNLLKAQYYLEEVKGIAKGDQAAFGRMDRAIRGEGWDLVDGKDGIKYLDMGDGERIPATKEGIDRIMGYVSKGAAAEMNTRSMISEAATLGDPVKRFIARSTKALMPYNRDDATESLNIVKDEVLKSSEEEKVWNMFNQAIKDFRSSGLPTQAKMDELGKCIQFLQQIGYTVDGLDLKNPDPNQAIFKKIGTGEILDFNKFADLCAEKDVLGKRMDARVEQVKQTALARDKELFAREVAETRLVLSEQAAEDRKAKKGKGAGKNKLVGDWFGDGEGGGEEGTHGAPIDYKAEERNLMRLYGTSNIARLKSKDVQALVDAGREFEINLGVHMKNSGESNPYKLPYQALLELESDWNLQMKDAGMNPNIYHSPTWKIFQEKRRKMHEEAQKRRRQAADQERQVKVDLPGMQNNPMVDPRIAPDPTMSY